MPDRDLAARMAEPDDFDDLEPTEEDLGDEEFSDPAQAGRPEESQTTVPQSAVAPTPQVVQPAAVVPAAGQAQVPPAAPVQAAQAPVQGQPVAQPQAAAVADPAAGATAISQLKDAMEKNRETFISHIAKAYEGQFTDTDMQEYAEKPQVFFSKVAARLQVDIVQNMLGMLAQQIPVVVNGIVHARQVQREYEDQFYNSYTQFDRSQHAATIDQVARTVRAVNPNLPAAQIMPLIASMAAATLGLQQSAPGAASVQTQAPMAPQPGQPAVRRRRVQSFAPANNGQTPQGSTQNSNPWADMAAAVMADDRG